MLKSDIGHLRSARPSQEPARLAAVVPDAERLDDDGQPGRAVSLGIASGKTGYPGNAMRGNRPDIAPSTEVEMSSLAAGWLDRLRPELAGYARVALENIGREFPAHISTR